MFAALALAAVLLAPGADGGPKPPPPPDLPRLERLRGLSFLRPVQADVITPGQFRDYLEGRLETELGMPFSDYLEILDVLGLESGRDDAGKRLLDLYVSQVEAFYDPKTARYSTIRPSPSGEAGAQMAPYVQLHELMHALQDQRFDAGLRVDEVEENWDRALAYHALLEGEATLVMFAAIADTAGAPLSTFTDNPDLADALSSASVIPDAPPYFVESMKFPYLDGLMFVIAAYRQGGWKAIDALHRNPPATTEEVLHPEVYAARVSAGEQAEPAMPASRPGVLFATTLGEFHWRYLLGDTAAQGWKADEVEVLRQGKVLRVCAGTEWDTEKDAQEFATAFRALLERRALSGTVERKGRAVDIEFSSVSPREGVKQ